MSATRKTRIIRAFDRAEAYDTHARTQRIVAERLAAQIAGLDLDPALPALEIGCGTGFLTAPLLNFRPEMRLTISDISPAMVERAQVRIGNGPTLRYAVIDGEQPGDAPEGGYGLIASSLAFQWFETLEQAIGRLHALLAPGGWLAFTTLLSGTFVEWRTALEEAGLHPATRRYPSADALKQLCDAQGEAQMATYITTDHYHDGLEFLRRLKAIGATTPWTGTGVSSLPSLRQAISGFEKSGSSISYEIAEVVIQRKK